MVAVLASFTIMMTVLLGGVAYLASSTKYSRYDQDNDLALAAAQSGLSDLLSRVRADDDYLSNVATTASDSDGYCGIRATGGPEGDYFASDCGWGSSTDVGWQGFGELVGGEFRQHFHYVVTDYDAASRSAEVVSTGRSGDVVRSLAARMAKDNPAMYLYLTDYEMSDPSDWAVYPDGWYPVSDVCGAGWPDSDTKKVVGYRWEWAQKLAANPAFIAPPARIWYVEPFAQYCRQEPFGPGDLLKGRVHSNDTMLSTGTATFIGPFTTANPKCDERVEGDPSTYKYCVESKQEAHPLAYSQMLYAGGVWPAEAPARSEVLDIPKVPDKAAIGNKGCQYQGATRIIFNGDGTMTVWSNYGLDEPNAGCGSLSELASSTGARVNVPSVIYVKTVDKPLMTTAMKKRIPSGGLDGELPLGTYQATDENPPTDASDEYTIEISMDRPDKLGGGGNVWVEGKTQGRTTIFADASIIVTGDLITEDKEKDLLGLMATGSVEVYNPGLKVYTAKADAATGDLIWFSDPFYNHWMEPQGIAVFDATTKPWPKDYNGDGYDMAIHAAIIAGNGSFRVQNSNKTQAETTGRYLNVYGSISQNFRGVTGLSLTNLGIPGQSAGYQNDYEYNQTLMKRQPPLFPYIGNGKWWVPWEEKVEPHDATKLPIP
jgi:hypothetical protein